MQVVLPEATFIHPLWNGNVIDGNDIALLRLGIHSEHIPIRLPPILNAVADGSQLQILGWGFDGSLTISPVLQQAQTIEIINLDICRSDNLWGSIIKDSMICAFGFRGEEFCKGDGFILKCYKCLSLLQELFDLCSLLLHVHLVQIENIMKYKLEHLCAICGVLGDSGGPLLLPFAPGSDVSSGQPELDVLLGIISFGDGRSDCGMSKLPSVYTNVGSFLDWIRDTMDVR